MNYKTILIFFLVMMLPVRQAWSDEERYRVEVLVLYHLRHEQEPQEIQVLNDYSSALDFLQPEETGTDQQAPDVEEPTTPADQAEDAPNAVLHVAEPGPEMQEAWRRLRASAPFRPLQYLAWEQGSNPPFPVLRVHDPEIVLVQDPWAEQRAAVQNTYGLDREDTLPDPVTYYRLDGTASLARSRFLHLAVTIEWREPIYDADDAVQSGPLQAAGQAEPGMEPEQLQPSAFLVHRIEQRRAVRTGRMEYFDSPALGVLAYVTRLEDAVTEPMQE